MKLTYNHTRITCYIGYTISATINNLPPLLFTAFKSSFNITNDQLAVLIILNFAIQFIVDFSGSRFIERIGYRMCACISQVFAAAGLIGLAIIPFILTSPFAGLMLSAVLYGIGSGLLEVLISPMIEALPSKSKEASMSLLHSFYCWGSVGVVLVATLFFTVFGVGKWPALCLALALLPIVCFFLFARVPIATLSFDKENFSSGKLLKSKIFWSFAIIMLCSGASELAMSQWASLFAEEALGVSKTLGDLLGPLMFALMMGISRLFYGKFGAKIKLLRFIFLCSCLCIASYLIVSLAPNPIISLLGCGLCGLSVGIMWPGALSLSSAVYPKGGASMFALLAMFGDIGCATGPQAVAFVSKFASIDGSGLKAGLLCAIVFPILIILSLISVKQTNESK